MLKTKEIIEIKKGVFWLGVYRQEQLELNIYLRTFEKDGIKIHLLIDPGPPVVFDALYKSLEEKTESVQDIQFVFLNHQDPDVCFNTLYLSKLNPNLKVISTEDTWRLVNFLGLDSNRFLSIDKFKSLNGRLSTGHKIRFVPTPFCHFRGSAMLYDEESRVLFSGDLFGGLTYSAGLYATPNNWQGIELFHQIYMPSQSAIQAAINAIRNLSPAPEIIAPQHGALIKGNLINEFMEKLYDLPVGPDLLSVREEEKKFYIEAINEIVLTVRQKTGNEVVEKAFAKVNSDPTFPNLFELDDQGNVWNIKIDPGKSFRLLFENMISNQPPQTVSIIKNAVLKASVEWHLPLYFASDNEDEQEIDEDTLEVILP